MRLYRIAMEVVVPADSLEEALDTGSHLTTSCDVKYVLDQHNATIHVMEPDSHNERGERVFTLHPENEPEEIPGDDLEEEEQDDE